MSLLSSWRSMFGLPDLPPSVMTEGDDTFGTAYVENEVLRRHVESRNEDIRARLGANADLYLEGALRYRAGKYTEHLSQMAPSSEMTLWAIQMAATYSPYVKVHHFVHDNWLTALLVIRYGEEPNPALTVDGTGWPLAFTDADRERAATLLAGRDWPDYVTILPRYV